MTSNCAQGSRRYQSHPARFFDRLPWMAGFERVSRLESALHATRCEESAILSNAKLIILTGILALTAGCVVNPVTGQRELGVISTEQQINMGKQQYVPAQQMQGGQYVVDPGVTAYVQQVGQRLAAVSDVALPYEFVVLNNSVPNAWALPGGKIAVNRGLLVEMRVPTK